MLVVSYGSLQALAGVVGTAFSRTADEMRGREIWLRFATWILLALEFALAADLVRTAVAPTWDDISKLAVIATIRTMLRVRLGTGIRRKSAIGLGIASPNRLDPRVIMCLSGPKHGNAAQQGTRLRRPT